MVARNVDPTPNGGPPRKYGDPEPASDLLGALLKTVQTKTSRSEFARALTKVLPDTESENCRVLGFLRGTLSIEVDSATLFAELSGFRRESLREAMNERLSEKRIAKIVFRMDGTGHV